MKIHNSILDISNNYDGLILDIWGVLHSSGIPFKNVLQNLETLQKQGKHVILVSNAPRRSIAVENFLQNTVDIYKNIHFNNIITSGEVFFLENSDKNCNIFYIGPKKDLTVLNNLNLNIVNTLQESPQFGVLTGFEDNVESRLDDMLKNKLPLYCLNPDIFITKNDGSKEKCAGFLAQKYKSLGGEVIYFGKPYKTIYSKVLLMFLEKNIDINKIIAVGDGMETDILGANNAGIASALCLAGLPSYELSQNISLEIYLQNFSSSPNFIIKSL